MLFFCAGIHSGRSAAGKPTEWRQRMTRNDGESGFQRRFEFAIVSLEEKYFVHRGEIEVQLASPSRLESPGLDFDDE
jgi:hypothetical protein